jgi:hypothetical protein
VSDQREDPQQDEPITLEVHDGLIGAGSEITPDDK